LALFSDGFSSQNKKCSDFVATPFRVDSQQWPWRQKRKKNVNEISENKNFPNRAHERELPPQGWSKAVSFGRES
jgi:hypothetical protein